MPLSDKQIDNLIQAGATDEEILEVEKEMFGALPTGTGSPGVGERMGLGALSGAGAPVASYQALFGKGPSTGIEKASAIAGDIGGAAATGAMTMASGGIAPALRALLGGTTLGAAQGAISPVLETAGKVGSSIGSITHPLAPLKKLIPENTQSMGLGMLRQIPEASGEVIGKLAPGLAMAILGGKLTRPAAKFVPKGQEAQALARTMQGMDLPVTIPKSSKPGDVISAFKETRQNLGADVGAANKELFKTEASVPQIIRRIAGKGYKAVRESAEIPITEKGLVPELSKQPEAAKFILDKLEKLGGISRELNPRETMQVADNMIKQMQGKALELKQSGSTAHPAIPVFKNTINEMKEALKSLSGPEAVKISNAADKAFSKMATLDEMAVKASKTMAQEGPRFNTRKFVFMWEAMDPKKKTGIFAPDEIKAMDFLVSQNAPTLAGKAMRSLAELAVASVNKLGLLSLKHHPAIRFKEMKTPLAGKTMKIGPEQVPAVVRQPLSQEEKRKKAAREVAAYLGVK